MNWLNIDIRSTTTWHSAAGDIPIVDMGTLHLENAMKWMVRRAENIYMANRVAEVSALTHSIAPVTHIMIMNRLTDWAQHVLKKGTGDWVRATPVYRAMYAEWKCRNAVPFVLPPGYSIYYGWSPLAVRATCGVCGESRGAEQHHRIDPVDPYDYHTFVTEETP